MSEIEILLPKWLTKRYAVLLKYVGYEPFAFEKASGIIEKHFKNDDDQVVRLFLSQLRKAGWLTATLDEKDNRIRIYKLKEPNLMFKEIANKIMLSSKRDNDGAKEKRA